MLRISLPQLMQIVAVIALALVSLCYASAWWESIILCLGMVTFFALLIVALIDRGSRQAFAIGMAVVTAGYTGAKWLDPGIKFRHFGLPTNALLMHSHAAVARDAYFDDQTGEQLVGFTPPTNARPGQSNTRGFYQGTVPHVEHFLLIGHIWFALLFGFLGGLFARSVYLRRLKKPQTP
jgi:hypothetical protein